MTARGALGPARVRAHPAGPARPGVALLLAAAVAGCGACSPAARDDGLAVAYYAPTGTGGDAALLAGVVEDLDGCLVVVRRDAADAPELTVAVLASTDDRARDVAVGSTVELGGGGPPGLDESWDYPGTCPAEEPFSVVAQPG